MRLAALLLATTACGQLFGLEPPHRMSDAAIGDADVPLADADEDAPVIDAMWLKQTFRNDVDGYTSASDTYIDSGIPNQDRSNDDTFRVRFQNRWGLLQFRSIFGSTAIPAGSTIVSATLQYTLASTNCVMQLREVAVFWVATDTYNTFGGDPGIDVTEVGPVVVASLPLTPQTVVVDVTSSLQSWSSAPATNHGWVFEATADGGDCQIRSGDWATVDERPLLTVTYF